MTDTTKPQNTPKPQEIDTAALDQVVGAGGIMIEARRNQEQADKLAKENHDKVSA